MSFLRRAGLLALALRLFFHSPDTWSLGLALPVQELTLPAELVASGTVTQLQTLRVGPGRLVYTLVRLQPESVLEGPAEAASLYILTPGGALPLEDLGVWVSDQARFQLGERVLVALEPSPYQDGRWCVLGRAQGKVSLGPGDRPRTLESAIDLFRRAAPAVAAPEAQAASLVPYDFLSVATHEQGHFTGLGDLYNNAGQGRGTNGYQDCMGRNNQQKTMYGVISSGSTSARDLHPADVLGQEWLYGRLSLPIGPGPDNESLFGYFCSGAQPQIQCSSQVCQPRIHWDGLPVSYRIHTADFHPEHVQLLHQGFAVWEAVPTSNFAVRYEGDTSVDAISPDDRTSVLRVSNPDNPDDRAVLGSSLAVSSLAWFLSSGRLSDVDITFNHVSEISPRFPAAAEQTPTPEENGGGCGTAGAAPSPPSASPGGLLLIAASALALFLRTGRPARAQS